MSIYNTYQMIGESELGLNNFFSISIFEESASVIGNYTKELYDKCTSLGYIFEWNANTNCLQAKNEVITINLYIKP